MVRGLAASGTSRTTTTGSKPLSRLAPITFMWSARLKRRAEADITERPEYCVIKALGARKVADADGDVIEHGNLLSLIGFQALRRHWNSARNRQVAPPSVENSPSHRNESALILLK